MGFSYETAVRFFDAFLKHYTGTGDEGLLNDIKKNASLICYIRMINKIHKKAAVSDPDREVIKRYMQKVSVLVASRILCGK